MDNDFETFKAFNLNWNTKMSFLDKLQIAEKSDQLNYNGCIALENDDVYLAKVYLEKALEVMPNNSDALQNLILCYETLNDYANLKLVKMKLQHIDSFSLRESSNKVQASTENELDLDFVFHSSDHLRYQNGVHVSGPHGGAPRAVKVEANISGQEGYTVTILNTDDNQVVVQMAPKQMKLLKQDINKIHLKGYGCDRMGASFADYGITIFHVDGKIEKCILHMYDRNVDIEYLS